ncbi:MAG: DUF202 domain-containing protein [Candidatus Eremiobacteraeota bacterium]|nr:DUF202 domain-containing protein [Candidatus Eremiobacteraeota bacterium]MBV8644790.1 DUF202 domain-containing protein [Candidatus Eremiobacteraeota bacterium]
MEDRPREIRVEATVRDHLANERTFLAYVRTSLALVGFGFLIARLDPQSKLSLAFGLLMLAVGIAFAILGAVRYVEERRALLEHSTRTLGPSAVVAIAAALTAFGALAVFDLVVVR